MNTVFRLVNPLLDRNMFIFKLTVFIERAKYESNPVLKSSLRIFNMLSSSSSSSSSRYGI